jgi:type II secretory pathway pseudopilin PulG
MRFLKKIFSSSRERGFTLIEIILVAGLTTLISVGVVAGLVEGLNALNDITDQQSVEFGHQRAMQLFTSDVQAATWFCNTESTTHDESGTVILRDATEPYTLTMGHPGEDNVEEWVQYTVRPGIMTGQDYLLRVKATDVGTDGMSIMSTGIAKCTFEYYDSDGNITDTLSKVDRITMILSVSIGGTTEEKQYFAKMRTPNLGVKSPPVDFNDVISKYFINK